MKYIVYLIAIGGIIAITFGLFSVWGWNGFVPNAVLLVVISLALAFNNLDYLFVAFIGGAWMDVMYGLPIGSFTIPLLVCGALSALLFRKWLFTEVKWYHFMGTVIIATIVTAAWVWFYVYVLFLFGWSPISISGLQLIRNGVYIVVANIILAYPIYIIVEMVAQSTTYRLQKNRIRL